MTVSKDAVPRAQDGYWAVEMWPADSRLERPRFVCHAGSEASARDMASRLMGATRDIHGFTYYRLQPTAGQTHDGSLPPMDCTQAVASGAWDRLSSQRERRPA